MSGSQKKSLADLLKATSRSFYTTLRVLPRSIGPQIGLAYLLARMTDTIADTEIVPVEQRLLALQQLRERILGMHRQRLEFGELAQRQGSPAERILLERCEEALAVLEQFNAADQQRIQDVLKIITSGQELDLRRFAGTSVENIIALPTGRELDDYTYRVAGCVGEFWTKMCRTHLFHRAALDDQQLLADGVRFGKGLQLVNILRDLPADLRQGRCYLPADELSAAGLAPKDLLDPANEPKLRPVYDRYLAMAEGHLAAGWAYTNALPWRCVRVRLACAWPVLIGTETLEKLHTGNVLNPAERIKISRSSVKSLIFRSVLCYPWPPAWRRLFPVHPAS
ncbi:MAG: Farnesyl-diphosphate farnesyltransferase [Pedosphaera sp.]|nr:Farnesyl-diphosphate farnesyltransferase [Pedosphaera sp.]